MRGEQCGRIIPVVVLRTDLIVNIDSSTGQYLKPQVSDQDPGDGREVVGYRMAMSTKKTNIIMRQISPLSEKSHDNTGFTLLEVMLVLTILGFLAAMIYPAVGLLNDRERERITRERIEEIRSAIVGATDRFDASGRRIIGGYVGDMREWPELWEPAPQVKKSVIGIPPLFDVENPTTPTYYLFRPDGQFVGGVWRWQSSNQPPGQPPFRKLSDAVGDLDHIGGLETENEGQPVGLWTDTPNGETAEILDPNLWRGPYLVAPVDRKPEDSGHLAESDGQYHDLAPAYLTALSAEDWEDGVYSPADGDPGEHGDDKEDFRLRQTEGRLADAWERALRFFITADPDRAGETIFWIVSEGADGEGTYPNKWNAGENTINSDNTMARKYDPLNPTLGGYNPDDEYNKDNIVMKINSSEWRAIFTEQDAEKRRQTEDTLKIIRRALIGDSTAAEGGSNTGFTGSLCRWPRLFRWEDNGTPNDATDDFWDDQDAVPTSSTKGQPRGLWTDTPNSADTADNLVAPAWNTFGIGWKRSYLPPPFGNNGEEKLLDAWGRELLFFQDSGTDTTLFTNDDILLVLSRGPDGRFAFGTTDSNNREPEGFTEAISVSSYTASDAGGYNADNVVLIVRGSDWQPARLTLNLTLLNATLQTRAMLVYGWNGAPLTKVASAPSALTDEDSDGSTDDWRATPSPSFVFTNLTGEQAITGDRTLVLWEDTVAANNLIDSGETYATLPLTLHVYKDTNLTWTIDRTTTSYLTAP